MSKGQINSTTTGEGTGAAEPREMITPLLRKSLTKQGNKTNKVIKQSLKDDLSRFIWSSQVIGSSATGLKLGILNGTNFKTIKQRHQNPTRAKHLHTQPFLIIFFGLVNSQSWLRPCNFNSGAIRPSLRAPETMPLMMALGLFKPWLWNRPNVCIEPYCRHHRELLNRMELSYLMRMSFSSFHSVMKVYMDPHKSANAHLYVNGWILRIWFNLYPCAYCFSYSIQMKRYSIHLSIVLSHWRKKMFFNVFLSSFFQVTNW